MQSIDTPEGFLLEWWEVFWHSFDSRRQGHQVSREPCNEERTSLTNLSRNPRGQGPEGSSSEVHAAPGGITRWLTEGLEQQQGQPSSQRQIEGQLRLPTATGPNVNTLNDLRFLEIGRVKATRVNFCHISFDGKLVAIGGQDGKVILWCTNSLEGKTIANGHSQAITDIRFSPSMLRLATSSLDKTVKIWDLQNVACLITSFTGHKASVMSLDFHPVQEDLICSCDEKEIRFWHIKNPGRVRVLKGGASRVRYQSGTGKYLASFFGKLVFLIDLQKPPMRLLEGHACNVQSICWNSSGEHLVSVSEELLRVWRIDSRGMSHCIHVLKLPGKRFYCGAFHPCYPSILIIGCHQSMELWNMAKNEMRTPTEEPVYTLAVSKTSRLIASAGHNNVVKLWK